MKRTSFLVCLPLLLVPPPRATAQDAVPVGSVFQVNTYTTDDQGFPDVAAGPGGDFVVVWRSDGSAASDAPRIQLQRYNSDGSALGGEFQVNGDSSSTSSSPAVSMDESGRFVVVWETENRIRGRRFASNGDPLGPEFLVESAFAASVDPDLAVHPDGRFAVVWSADRSPGNDTSDYSIQARRFDSAGAALGGQFQVNVYTYGGQYGPALAIAPDGRFVVVWESYYGGGGTDSFLSIQARRFESDGNPVGTEFQVNSTTIGDQIQPAVASLGSSFVVVWTDENGLGGDPSDSIQARRFDWDGLPVGSQFQANTYTTGNQLRPTVAADELGRFLIAWSSPDERGISAQRLTHDGERLGSEFLTSTAVQTHQRRPAAAMTPNGDFVMTWESNASDFDDSSGLSVQAQRYGLAVIGDRVWRDLNENGVQDGGEPGVSGVVVRLFEESTVFIFETTTDVNGLYELLVPPGFYYLEIVAPEDDVFSPRDVGSDDELDSDVSEDGFTSVFAIASTDVLDLAFDAGLITAEAQVGDRVWLDANGDGIQNGGEEGVEGVTIDLYREPDPPFFIESTLVASAATDADGYYSFTVAPGTFYIEVDCSEASFTTPDQGNDDSDDSDVAPSTGTSSPFDLEHGDADGTRDAGLLDPDGDGVACSDNCPVSANPSQIDSDGDGSGDACDLCLGDDTTGDADGDGLCADLDCDDADPTNACADIFNDGFESGDTSAWSATVG